MLTPSLTAHVHATTSPHLHLSCPRVRRRYDLSLDLTAHDPSLSPHAHGMSHFTWSDFALCRWPSAWTETGHDTLTGSYPTRVAASLARLNDDTIGRVNRALRKKRGDAVFSFSHFLPRLETLPDWLHPADTSFDHEWLHHPAGSTAVKFSRVAVRANKPPRHTSFVTFAIPRHAARKSPAMCASSRNTMSISHVVAITV